MHFGQSVKSEKLLSDFCGLPVADFCNQGIHTGIDPRYILFVVKTRKGFDIAFVKACPCRYVDIPEILRLVSNAPPPASAWTLSELVL